MSLESKEEPELVDGQQWRWGDRSRKASVRLPPDLWEAVAKRAAVLNRSWGCALRVMLRETLKATEKPGDA